MVANPLRSPLLPLRCTSAARALVVLLAIGPPTPFLLDASGRELPGSRRVGTLALADIDRLATQAGL